MVVNQQNVQIGDIRLDIDRQKVTRNGKEIELAGLSFRLLRVLADNWPEAVSRRELAQEVWGDVVVSDNTLRQRIRLLRQSLGESDYISVVKGVGYRLSGPVRTPDSTTNWRMYFAAAFLAVMGCIAILVLGGGLGDSLIHELRHFVRH